MTVIHLTDAQRDTFAASGIIVIDGERWQGDCELCDNTRAVFDRWRTNAIVGRHEIYKPCPQCATTQGEAAWVAPEGWRILTEPPKPVVKLTANCSACLGSGSVRGGYPDYDALDCPRCDADQGVVAVGEFVVAAITPNGDGKFTVSFEEVRP